MSEDNNSSIGLLQRFVNTFTMNRYGGGAGFSNAATWVAMVSAITGGFIGLSTYRMDVDKQVDQSVEKTFEMIQVYNSGDMATPRKHVLSYVYARRECDSRIFSRDLSDDDFVRVLEFFDLVHACTQANLCDRGTAERFFEPHASFQWPVLKDTVAELRTRQNTMISGMPEGTFAAGMASFADPDATAPPCDGNF
jgi:hypothetical protein